VERRDEYSAWEKKITISYAFQGYRGRLGIEHRLIKRVQGRRALQWKGEKGEWHKGKGNRKAGDCAKSDESGGKQQEKKNSAKWSRRAPDLSKGRWGGE